MMDTSTVTNQIEDDDGKPNRSYMDDTAIKWKHEKPDYTIADQAYMDGKTRQHQAGSLEKLVENLVKTWEMESTHKPDVNDWGTISHGKFTISCNGGKPFTVEDNIAIGNYNMMLAECPFYDVNTQTHESSHRIFKNCFPDGFPWELLDILSGPPRVTFTWRHWADWTGPFMDHQPTGEHIEMKGVAIAKVDEHLKIEELEVYFDPNLLLMTFYGGRDKCLAGILKTDMCTENGRE